MGTITGQIEALHSHKKTKKSFTISPESVQFLELLCKQKKALSVSAVLEDILQTARRETRNAQLEQSVDDYYSSLSPAEMEEQVNWGKFALSEFPVEGR